MFKRKLEVGDAIVCRGVKAEILEIFYQDAYIEDSVPEDRKYIDIEFKDTKGKYRHWKSKLDGGSIQYKEDYQGKPNGKYFLKVYRTHEDEQYGHSDFLEAKEYRNLELAEKRLKSLYEPRRHYQVMVVDSRDRSVIAIRDREVYRFLYRSVLTELIKQLLEKLSDGVGKIEKDLALKSLRCELYEEKGDIYLKVDGSTRHLFKLSDKKILSVFEEDLDDLIKAVNRLTGKPVKRVGWSTWYDFDRCYYSNSEDEKGSVDLYFDFF